MRNIFMNRWEHIAIITFIACDAVLENLNWFKNSYKCCYKSVEKRVGDIVHRLSK